MRYTYQSGSNTATNGISLGGQDTDVYVHKIIIGLPVSGGNIILYNKTAAYSGDTSNIAFKVTLPTFSTTNVNPGVYVLDFANGPLQLDGGNLMIDQTMQVTVIWEPVSESSEG